MILTSISIRYGLQPPATTHSRTDGPSVEYDVYTFTYFLCHIGIPVLYRQRLPPHFPTHSPHRNGSKVSYVYMEIQCSILMTSQLRIDPTIEVRTCFYSFVLYDNETQTPKLSLLRPMYIRIPKVVERSRINSLHISNLGN